MWMKMKLQELLCLKKNLMVVVEFISTRFQTYISSLMIIFFSSYRFKFSFLFRAFPFSYTLTFCFSWFVDCNYNMHVLRHIFSLHFDENKLDYDGESNIFTSSRLLPETMEFVINFNTYFFSFDLLLCFNFWKFLVFFSSIEVKLGFQLVGVHQIDFDYLEKFLISKAMNSFFWKTNDYFY